MVGRPWLASLASRGERECSPSPVALSPPLLDNSLFWQVIMAFAREPSAPLILQLPKKS